MSEQESSGPSSQSEQAPKTPPKARKTPPKKVPAQVPENDPLWTKPGVVYACEIFVDLGVKVLLALVAVVIYVWGFYLLTQDPKNWPLATFESVVSMGWVYLMRHYFPASKAKQAGW